MAMVLVVSAQLVAHSQRPSQSGRRRSTRTNSTTTCAKRQRVLASLLVGVPQVFAGYRLVTTDLSRGKQRSFRIGGLDHQRKPNYEEVQHIHVLFRRFPSRRRL